MGAFCSTTRPAAGRLAAVIVNALAPNFPVTLLLVVVSPVSLSRSFVVVLVIITPVSLSRSFVVVLVVVSPASLSRSFVVHDIVISQASLARSFVVGDKWLDVQLGRAVGARAILVRTGTGAAEERWPPDGVTADAVVDNLAAAASWNIGNLKSEI